MNFKKILGPIIVGILGTGCSLFGIRSEEQPSYEVLHEEENKEIRKYKSYIIAKTTIEGTFEEAQTKGFKILAGYIFGKNKSQQKIAMTAPVVQKSEDSSEKIAMTAPVILAPNKGQKEKAGLWTMSFSMPSKYNLEALPTPEDNRIILEKVAPRYVAAIIFTGFWSESKIENKGKDLIAWLDNNKKYKVMSEPMFAGYNPPWALPFFRRNEVLVEINLNE